MSDDRLELPLFDPPRRETERELAEPLAGPADSPAVDRSTDEPIVVEALDLGTPNPEPATDPDAEPSPEPGLEADSAATYAAPQPASVGARLAAGFIDLLVHIALTGVLIGGSSLLGVTIDWSHAVPLAGVVGLFSFLYHVVPLAFWGRTPGMAVVGLRARTLDDEPLSLPQASRHWLALLLTAATGGLGVLLALGGRSLADRLSGSQTLAQ